jgi:hypothetical protein
MAGGAVMGESPVVFVSYSRKDAKWRDKFLGPRWSAAASSQHLHAAGPFLHRQHAADDEPMSADPVGFSVVPGYISAGRVPS